MFVPYVKTLDAVAPKKSLTNLPLHYIEVRDGKNEKKGKTNFSIMVFFNRIYLNPLKVYTKF